MAENLDQHSAVTFCFMLEEMTGQIVVMLKIAYMEAALRVIQVYEWFSHFKNGELSQNNQKTCDLTVVFWNSY